MNKHQKMVSGVGVLSQESIHALKAFKEKDSPSTSEIYQHKTVINFKRLLIQIAAVVLVFGAMLFLIRSRSGDGDASGAS